MTENMNYFIIRLCTEKLSDQPIQLIVRIFVFPAHPAEKHIKEVSWMIYSARPTIPPVAITILTWKLFSFPRFW